MMGAGSGGEGRGLKFSGEEGGWGCGFSQYMRGLKQKS